MSRVTIERLMAKTGVGKNTAHRLVRERKLPGFIDGRRYICTEGEYDHWERTGEVIQNVVRSTPPRSRKRTPLQVVRIKREEAA